MIKSKALRDSARDEFCCLNIVGICNGDTMTTVLCHLPDESHGMALKADDISSCYGCSACHAAIDGRLKVELSGEEREFYLRRAQVRTLRKMVEKGLIAIKGVKAA
jgi:hypothetical protein